MRNRKVYQAVSAIIFMALMVSICVGGKVFAILTALAGALISLMYVSISLTEENNGQEEWKQKEQAFLLTKKELEDRNQLLEKEKEKKTEMLKDALSVSEELRKQLALREQEKEELKNLAQEKPEEKAEELPLLPPETSVELLDLLETARKSVAKLETYAKQSGIKIQISSGMEKIMLKADAFRMEVLFRNIIDNSIKYMKQEGALVITVSMIGSDIFIILKDTGEGLSPDETSHIFELNYQGSNRISGNGLGLSQAKAIVKSYGGTIYAKSTLGNGMGIYIQLPTKE